VQQVRWPRPEALDVLEGLTFIARCDMAFKEGGSPDVISETSLRELCNRCAGRLYSRFETTC
jgi:hypothetical protein